MIQCGLCDLWFMPDQLERHLVEDHGQDEIEREPTRVLRLGSATFVNCEFEDGTPIGYPEQHTGPRIPDAELDDQHQRDAEQAGHRARLGTDYTGRLPAGPTYDEEQYGSDRAEDAYLAQFGWTP